MNKAVEKGKVVRVEGDTAYVLFKRSSACGKCTACGMLRDMSEITVPVKNVLDAEEGDIVTLEMPGESILKGSLAAYIFPLIMLIGGALLGYYIFGDIIGISKDLSAAIFGLGLTAIAFLVLKFMEPVFARKLDRFKLINKEKEHDSTSE